MRRRIKLDELMIINPRPTGAGRVLLGDDGVLYHLETVDDAADLEDVKVGSLFLGDDGWLYKTSD